MTDLVLSKWQQRIRPTRKSTDTQVRVLSKPPLFLCMQHVLYVSTFSAQPYCWGGLSTGGDIALQQPPRHKLPHFHPQFRAKEARCTQPSNSFNWDWEKYNCQVCAQKYYQQVFPNPLQQVLRKFPCFLLHGCKVIGWHPQARYLHLVTLNRGCPSEEPCRNINLYIHSLIMSPSELTRLNIEKLLITLSLLAWGNACLFPRSPSE